MSNPTRVPSPDHRRATLQGDGVKLSALLREPTRTPPKATVVALHGAGMSAAYFDGTTHPDLSLLDLGTHLGFTVLAVDRPGYGSSARQLPDGQTLRQQARTLRAGLSDFADRYPIGAGFFLLGHSFGGKLALTLAAYEAPDLLIGIDVSGCGHRYAVAPYGMLDPSDGQLFGLHWGRLRLYPPNTFRSSAAVVAPLPARERLAAARWPADFGELAPRVRTPLRFTFADHEAWWQHDAASVADLVSRFTASPRVQVDRQAYAGHNISLGWTARSYHLRALGFFEECLAPLEAFPAPAPAPFPTPAPEAFPTPEGGIAC
ncbi:alpha/beta hydrolase [Micromonosporaceae bacterium Da 78-11]